MIYIIVMFFILELLLATIVCCGIMHLDKKINAISERFKVNRHTLKFKLRAIYDVANKSKLRLIAKKQEFERKRRQLVRTMIKWALLTVSLFIFKKTKHKNKVLFVEFLLVLYDTLRADCFA